MFLSRTLRVSYKELNARATEFLVTKRGRWARIGLLAGTVALYPVFSLVTNGPLVKYSFGWRHPLEAIPADMQSVIEEEYKKFLEQNARLAKDAAMNYRMCTSTEDMDTLASGSLGVRTGLELALPFYFRFKSEEEAIDYFRSRYADGIPYLGDRQRVSWDTPSGRDLASAFVMSKEALRFIVQRDLYAHDGWSALAQRSISWTTWTTFTSIFTYWLHNTSKIFGASAASFVVIYCVFLAAAWFSNTHWHYLYRYMTDVYADSVAAKQSFEHCEGGKEFYWKALKRNRLLRDMNPSLASKVTMPGDVRGIPTSIIVRFDHLKDLNEEDDELKQVVGQDD